tara:strand:- start:2890 stop:3123 length:234 start_codon:yes stop_codon:yes gene_type:complete
MKRLLVGASAYRDFDNFGPEFPMASRNHQRIVFLGLRSTYSLKEAVARIICSAGLPLEIGIIRLDAAEVGVGAGAAT